MDILSDVIQSAGVQSTLLTRNAFYQPWALHFPCQQLGSSDLELTQQLDHCLADIDAPA